MHGRIWCRMRQLGIRNAERGGSLVEFAVILPPALILLVGIIQFGIAMFEYHATDYAAKFGARYAAVHGADCSATGCPITQAALQTAVQSAVPGAGNATVQAQWTTPPIGTYAGTTNNSPNWTCSRTSESKGCFV